MKKSKVELLAPAGSFESLKAAVNAGCDAVYIGGSKFGARAYADNPEEDMLIKAIEYAHLHGKQIYLTVNTLLKDDELKEQLYDYLLPYYQNGLDAVIVQDLGVFKFIKENFPNIDIHASTQMTVCNYEAAQFLKDLGASRVVTARELSCNEIKEIHDKVGVEIESFVHGALCYCYSGQCFLSSFIGGRSGNRGRCAQPCRLPYKVVKNDKIINSKEENYVLSPKDMCTLDLIPDIIESGVYSFKIEGRMKKPEYTAGVVRIYRKYIDMYLKYGREGFKVSKADKQELFDIFNRCGFNSGYYKQHNGRDMITLTEPQKRARNEALYNELSKYVDAEEKIKITGHLYAEPEKNIQLSLFYNNIVVSCEGGVVQTAQNHPMTADKLRTSLEKTGNTSFVFDNIDIEINGDIFVPVKFLNELRREALEKLEHAIYSEYYRDIPNEMVSDDCLVKSNNFEKNLFNEYNNNISSDLDITANDTISENTASDNNDICIYQPKLNVYIESLEYLDTVLKFDEVNAVYIDSNCLDMLKNINQDIAVIDKCHSENKKVYIVLPHIFRDTKATSFRPFSKILETDIDGVVVKNIEEIQILKNMNFAKDIIADYNLYTFNSTARDFWTEQGVAYDTAPVELNYRELKKRGVNNTELIVYGYLPVMVSAQCIHKTIEGCDKTKTRLYLKDRYNKEFLVKNNCKYCYNTIYNCQPLVLLDCFEDIKMLKPASLRINLTQENPKEVRQILTKYIDRFIYNKPVENDFDEFTRGHFKRGIE